MSSKISLPKNEGARIAILGSGPSLVEALNAEYDIGIAVNAAIRLPGLNFQYFFSSHPFAHDEERGWKELLQTKPEIGVLVSNQSAAYWETIFPDEEQRTALQREYERMLENDPRTQELLNGTYEDGKKFNQHFIIPEPVRAPNGVYMIRSISKIEGGVLNQDQFIISGASSSGGAVQAAYLMGARSIDLFGVQMNNHEGGNYGIQHRAAEKGRTSEKQRMNMEKLFDELHEKNIPITIHGEHAFTNDFLKE